MPSSAITRLKAGWWDGYGTWRRRGPKGRRYVHIRADGVHLTPRLDGDRQCMSVMAGADEYGEKDVPALMDGFRGNADGWLDPLRGLKKRGLTVPPELAMGDGATGFRTAPREVFPDTRERRRRVHRTANVPGAMPKSPHEKARAAPRDIWMAGTGKEASAAFDLFAETYGVKYGKAVGRLAKGRNRLLTFHDYPAEHRKRIGTTNPIESVLATLRNRTRRTGGGASTAKPPPPWSSGR